MSKFEVKFTENSMQIKGKINDLSEAVLEEVCGELESAVKRNTAVDTGQTKNNWQHRVTSTKTRHEGVVGNPLQNAIWEELGTGEYALYGNGRKGGWFYVDAKGEGHFTYGKHPRRAFWKAYSSLKNKIIKHIQDAFKGGIS